MVKENNQTLCYRLLTSIVQYNFQQEFIITQLLQLIIYIYIYIYIYIMTIKNENHTIRPFFNGLPDMMPKL